MTDLREGIESVFPDDSLGFPYSQSYLLSETNKVNLLSLCVAFLLDVDPMFY